MRLLPACLLLPSCSAFLLPPRTAPPPPLFGFLDDVKSSISSAFVDSSSAGSDPLSAIEGQNEAAPRRSPARAKSSGEIPPDAFTPVVLELFLYLTGVPEKDVSSDLWREQVSITGGEYDAQLRCALPAEPQQAVEVLLHQNRSLTVTDSSNPDYIEPGSGGAWRLAFQDGRNLLRVQLLQAGFRRVVVASGTMESVYGGEGNAAMKSASFVPPGAVFVDFEVGYGGTPGTYEVREAKELPLVRCEVESGFLKVASLQNCGRCEGRVVQGGDE